MKRKMIVEHLRKRRGIVILTFVLLLLAFAENYYLNCTLKYSFPVCELGWIYVILAIIMAQLVYYYRK